MQPVAFCIRCRGMKIGFNKRYIVHRLNCEEWLSRSAKLLILTALITVLVIAFPTPGSIVFSELSPEVGVPEATAQAGALTVATPAVLNIGRLLKAYKVDEEHRDRVAQAVVASSRKYNLDPRLLTAIMIVESGADPFAISVKESIGIMQIHLPTWGDVADKEGINLFKIEDNVDLGARILRDYVRRHGLWEGVKRYKGWNADSPNSTQNVQDYLEKVQRIYQPKES